MFQHVNINPRLQQDDDHHDGGDLDQNADHLRSGHHHRSHQHNASSSSSSILSGGSMSSTISSASTASTGSSASSTRDVSLSKLGGSQRNERNKGTTSPQREHSYTNQNNNDYETSRNHPRSTKMGYTHDEDNVNNHQLTKNLGYQGFDMNTPILSSSLHKTQPAPYTTNAAYSSNFNYNNEKQAQPHGDQNGDSLRDELDEVQRNVVTRMTHRLLIGFGTLLIPQIMLLSTMYWYTTIISMLILSGVFVYCWTHRERKSDFILMYSILLVMNWIKDVVLSFFFIFASSSTPFVDLTTFEYFMVIFLIIDAGIFTPYSLYYCFWLHRSLSVTVLSF